MLITPTFLETDFGKRAIFSGIKEAKLEHSLKARWQVTRNGTTEFIDVNEDKYKGSQLLPNLMLIINKASFEDEGFYQFQVMIEDGWCTSNRVELRKVRGSKKSKYVNRYSFKSFSQWSLLIVHFLPSFAAR